MIWWIVAGVAVAALGVLVVTAGVLRRQVLELHRVAELVADQLGREQRRIQARADSLQPVLAGLQRRAAAGRRGLVARRTDRTYDGRDTGDEPRSDYV